MPNSMTVYISAVTVSVISANGGMLCCTRHLFVCLSLLEQLRVKATGRIFMKILSEVHLWTRKSPLNVASHSHLVANSGIFKLISPLFSISRQSHIPRTGGYGGFWPRSLRKVQCRTGQGYACLNRSPSRAPNLMIAVVYSCGSGQRWSLQRSAYVLIAPFNIPKIHHIVYTYKISLIRTKWDPVTFALLARCCTNAANQQRYQSIDQSYCVYFRKKVSNTVMIGIEKTQKLF